MVDWLKVKVLGKSRENILKSVSQIGNVTRDKITDAVLLQTINYNKHIKIIIRCNSYVTIQGSIHKSLQDNNYSRFTYSSFQIELMKICNDLKINPEDCKITRIEFGVNLFNPILDFDTIYINALCYRGEPFIPMKNPKTIFGLWIDLSMYVIKIYNKSKQMSKQGIIMSDEILRYEIRIKNSFYLKRTGIENLKDLCDSNKMKLVKNLLINPIRYILFDDKVVIANYSNLKMYAFLHEARNPQFWLQLKLKSLASYSNKKKLFKTILSENGAKNYNQILIDIVTSEWEFLLAH